MAKALRPDPAVMASGAFVTGPISTPTSARRLFASPRALGRRSRRSRSRLAVSTGAAWGVTHELG
jgi:hypothetical protein